MIPPLGAPDFSFTKREQKSMKIQVFGVQPGLSGGQPGLPGGAGGVKNEGRFLVRPEAGRVGRREPTEPPP